MEVRNQHNRQTAYTHRQTTVIGRRFALLAGRRAR